VKMEKRGSSEEKEKRATRRGKKKEKEVVGIMLMNLINDLSKRNPKFARQDETDMFRRKTLITKNGKIFTLETSICGSFLVPMYVRIRIQHFRSVRTGS
jgi:hypothetical protein